MRYLSETTIANYQGAPLKHTIIAILLDASESKMLRALGFGNIAIKDEVRGLFIKTLVKNRSINELRLDDIKFANIEDVIDLLNAIKVNPSLSRVDMSFVNEISAENAQILYDAVVDSTKYNNIIKFKTNLLSLGAKDPSKSLERNLKKNRSDCVSKFEFIFYNLPQARICRNRQGRLELNFETLNFLIEHKLMEPDINIGARLALGKDYRFDYCKFDEEIEFYNDVKSQLILGLVRKPGMLGKLILAANETYASEIYSNWAFQSIDYFFESIFGIKIFNKQISENEKVDLNLCAKIIKYVDSSKNRNFEEAFEEFRLSDENIELSYDCGKYLDGKSDSDLVDVGNKMYDVVRFFRGEKLTFEEFLGAISFSIRGNIMKKDVDEFLQKMPAVDSGRFRGRIEEERVKELLPAIG